MLVVCISRTGITVAENGEGGGEEGGGGGGGTCSNLRYGGTKPEDRNTENPKS